MNRRASPIAVSLALIIAVAGCDTPGPSAAPTQTPAPAATPTLTTYDLETVVWYEGLILRFGQATALLDARGGTIDVTVTIENPTPEPSSLDASISLFVAGVRVTPTRDSKVPTPPGGESRLAVLRFELQEIGSADDAVLEVGAAPEHVAKVPFTAAGGPAVVFQPIEFELKGSGSAGDLRLTLRRAVVRWDLPDWSEQLRAGFRVITITYDATYTGSFSGGFPFTGENVALRLPNGDVVESRRDGHSQSIELIAAKKTKKNLSSRFEIPAAATGEFALIVRNGSSERAIKFTVEG